MLAGRRRGSGVQTGLRWYGPLGCKGNLLYKHTAIAVVLVIVCSQAMAQDYPLVPEPGEAFIAPLATEAMLLDGIAVDGRLVVAGEHGIVLISDDGGLNWTQPQTHTRATLTGVHFHDRETGWVVGHDALILRTRDGGKTWEEVYSDPEDERPLFDVWFDDADRGLAIGAYGLMLRTTDGGTSWDLLELAPQPWRDLESIETEAEDEGDEFDFEDDQFYDFHLNHIVPSANGDLYIAAEAGHFFRSGDGGETWFAMPTIYEGSFFNTLPLAGEQLLLMGLRGNLFRSNDGGQSWSEIETPVTVLLNDGLMLEDGTILIGGMAGALLESSDGGSSFELHQQADRKAISALLPVNGDVIVVGEAGVHRTTLDALRAGRGT